LKFQGLLVSDTVAEQIAALRDEDWGVREDAATALGVAQDSRAVLPLIRLLRDTDRAVREAATGALVKIGTQSVAELILALNDSQATVQECVAGILAQVGDERAVEPFVALLDHKNWILRMHASCGLGRIGHPRAVEPLIPLLQDTVKAVRNEAAQALGTLGKTAFPQLLEALSHREWLVRLHAVEAMGKIRAREAVAPLLTVLFHDADMIVKVEAARSLGQIGDPHAVSHLVIAMGERDLRTPAIEALGQIGDHQAIPALVAVLKGSTRPPDTRMVTGCGDQWDEEMTAMEEAVRALGRMKAESTIPVLISALRNTVTRPEAATALVSCGAAAIPPLLGVLKEEQDQNIRFHAQDALARLGWRTGRI
jgi:HEAT repeat protein